MITSTRESFIEFMPVSIFGSVMGLCGLSFAWRRAAVIWNIWELPYLIFRLFAIAAFIALSACYLVKWYKFRKLIIEEFRSPKTICFFATYIICLLLLPGVVIDFFPRVAIVIWCTGAILMLFFACYMLRRWLDERQEPDSAMPAWVLPIVGTLDIPIIGNQLPLPGIHEITMMAFGIGSVFALVLLVILISRLIFQAPLPEGLQPSLFILTAPLALAFTVYHQLTMKLDITAGTLFYFNLFLALLLGSKIFLIPRACPFKISWWSVSFPLSALSITALTYVENKPDWAHQLFAAGMLLLATIVISYLSVMTMFRVATKTF
ncbi:C4-dicarboxylate ABC transporter [Mucilaginibacter rubeus]|uniref:C4-dicarboxylate ABC transporter n=1 Tax=Mucilaginibacter rubeus TaxID=2027860 RepID=A0AAE6JDV2_9SPHI|nr:MULTISPECIES: SLAC1 anion channel family protein [Mucilaginibacter]QEM03746.1 C4-dicarboxylate ABC transporter [Mucilaginibacter rubeus]QEM16357.1 C4-dicarboxylate ABC transporter [Mucilaginibacter gossypii]QTE40875.1 SLAC1 anion channel family protein [Mucilaginibacter rubeus]QTE47478.1 SLAC1 anion channel family protein [Mucilaginibacter rubeus]QTE58871.1 SLAC1 anion channel family protein [Mucilaginibacter rubeus]